MPTDAVICGNPAYIYIIWQTSSCSSHIKRSLHTFVCIAEQLGPGPTVGSLAVVGFEHMTFKSNILNTKLPLHQLTAQQLPLHIMLEYLDLKWTILQRVCHTPKYHHNIWLPPFHDADRPFAFTQQLPDISWRRLLAEKCDTNIVDFVALEPFKTWWPEWRPKWVQRHCTLSLREAVQFTKDHLAACPRSGKPSSVVLLLVSLLFLPELTTTEWSWT